MIPDMLNQTGRVPRHVAAETADEHLLVRRSQDSLPHVGHAFSPQLHRLPEKFDSIAHLNKPLTTPHDAIKTVLVTKKTEVFYS